jgi:hypothetical protein
MRVRANFPLAARDVRLDLFRGLANWAIFLDHIPHEVLSSITTSTRHAGPFPGGIFAAYIVAAAFSGPPLTGQSTAHQGGGKS